MTDKYKYTAAEVFKLRMQYKAEFNNLRKTYHEIVLEKPAIQKKHFALKMALTTIVPEQERSLRKECPEKRHYTPTHLTQGI